MIYFDVPTPTPIPSTSSTINNLLVQQALDTYNNTLQNQAIGALILFIAVFLVLALSLLIWVFSRRNRKDEPTILAQLFASQQTQIEEARKERIEAEHQRRTDEEEREKREAERHAQWLSVVTDFSDAMNSNTDAHRESAKGARARDDMAQQVLVANTDALEKVTEQFGMLMNEGSEPLQHIKGIVDEFKVSGIQPDEAARQQLTRIETAVNEINSKVLPCVETKTIMETEMVQVITEARRLIELFNRDAQLKIEDKRKTDSKPFEIVKPDESTGENAA